MSTVIERRETETELTDIQKLYMGASGVGAIVTAAAILIHTAGLQTVFISTDLSVLVIEIGLGWSIMSILVFVIAGVFQWLSYYTPIPAVVR